MFSTPSLIVASVVTLIFGFVLVFIWEVINEPEQVCVCGHGLREHFGYRSCTNCRCRSFHRDYGKPK